MQAGDRVHVRHTTRNGGVFDYEAIVQARMDDIGAEPYYLVTGPESSLEANEDECIHSKY